MNMKSFIPIGRDRIVPRVENHPFLSMQRDMERMFEAFAHGFPGVGLKSLIPDIDVIEDDDHMEMTIELPGLAEKDVEVNVADGILTVRGDKKSMHEDRSRDCRIEERSYGSFSRSLELPAGVDLDSVQATMDKGVLTIHVPKPAAAETKTIAVKSVA